MERKYYLDNLRWMAILLLFPFHAAQIWSGGDYSGFYVWSHTNQIIYVFSTAVYPWFMTLLFTIAGMSAKIIKKIHVVRALLGIGKQKKEVLI